MKSILVRQAVEAVQATQEAVLRQLAREAREAREANLRAIKIAIRSLLPKSDKLYPVLVAAAASVTIGREDGYPARDLSPDGRVVWAQGVLAYVAREGLAAMHYAMPPAPGPAEGSPWQQGPLGVTARNQYNAPAIDWSRVAPVEQQTDYEAWQRLEVARGTFEVPAG